MKSDRHENDVLNFVLRGGRSGLRPAAGAACAAAGGAHDNAFRIPADGWSYPFVSGMTVLSRGEIRKDIRPPCGAL